MTKKLYEGMKRELEQTEATLTYQLGKREQTILQLQQQLTETSQAHVCTRDQYVLMYCIHSYQEDKAITLNQEDKVITLTQEKAAFEWKAKVLHGEQCG